MMIYHKASNQVYAVDFRESSKRADKDFLDKLDNVDNQALFNFSAGVPGTVAGLESIYEKFGTLPRERLLQDAIYYAKNGFNVDQDQHKVLSEKRFFNKR